MAVFLNTPEDMAWVNEKFGLTGAHGSAIIYGNEDAPEKVELWYAAEPAYNQEPDAVLWPGLNVDQAIVTAMVTAKRAGYNRAQFEQAVKLALDTYSTFAYEPSDGAGAEVTFIEVEE